MNENKTYPKGKELLEIFLSAIDSRFLIKSKQGSLLSVDFEGIVYDIYFKCVSYAGKSYPEDRTRSQLPQNQEFDKIIESDDRFLFLGYDVENDVFVCWDPVKAKSRLNKRRYVSFFSRKPLQQSVTEDNIILANLTNGDSYALFKRCDIPNFFERIERYFPQLVDASLEPVNDDDEDEMFCEDVKDILLSVEDDKIVTDRVISLLGNGKSSLDIIADCMNQFNDSYPLMDFKEWGKIVRAFIEKHEDIFDITKDERYMEIVDYHQKAISALKELPLNSNQIQIFQEKLNIILSELSIAKLSSNKDGTVDKLLKAQLKQIQSLFEEIVKAEKMSVTQQQQPQKQFIRGDFKVIFPDGTIFFEKNAINTYRACIKKIGYAQVQSVGIVRDGGNIVSYSKGNNEKYWKKIDGVYLFERLNNDTKIAFLKKISETLGLGLSIELVPVDSSEQVDASANATGSTQVGNSPNKNPVRQKIKVTFPEGKSICHNIVSNTFVEAIRFAGAERVHNLHIIASNDNLIVSKEHINPKYAATTKFVEGIWFCFTNISTDRKAEMLKQISNSLNLGWSVELV
jgi:hypothetical protein